MRDQHAKRFFLAAVSALLLSAVAACGGGGSGGSGGTKDLTVSFSYVGNSRTTQLFAQSTVAPSLGGLDGNNPRCAVSGGALPPGMSIIAGCVISGTPTAPGDFSATIVLTVDGYDGSVSTQVQISVLQPTLVSVRTATAYDADQDIALGVGATHLPLVRVVTLSPAADPSYRTQAGDQISYAVVSGAPPNGMSLDTADGTLSGAPLDPGVASFSLVWHITRGGLSFTTAPLAIRIAAAQAPFSVSYGRCCNASVGDDIALSPTSTFVAANGAATNFTLYSEVPGLTIDPSTGKLAGNLTTAGVTNVRVVETVTFADGSKVGAQVDMLWTVVGPTLNYANTPLHLTGGSAFSVLPDPIANTLPADVRSFALMPSPGSDTVVPGWLNIDPATGRLYGVAVTQPMYSATPDVTVVMTTHRNGHDYRTSYRFGIFSQ